MKIYISGKISGLPIDEAKDLFNAGCHQVRQLGYEPLDPMKIDHSHDGTWERFMINDIWALFDCHGIYMLSNWKESKGARIEHCIAVEMGKKIFYQ